MRSRTARFDRAITDGNYTLAQRVDVLFNRQPIITGLPITAGEIVFDRNSAVLARSTIQVACHPDDNQQPWGRLLPTATAGGPLSPYGYELAVYRGITYGTGDTEVIPQGIYVTQQTDIDLTLLATVQGCDRSQLVIDARLEEDYVIAAGTNTGSAIQALIEAGVPGLTFAFQSTANTTPANVLAAGDDRWEAAQKMAKDISCELFFNEFGHCTMRSEPGAESSPNFIVATADTTITDTTVPVAGRLTALNLQLTRAADNRVIATGLNSASPEVYRGVATIDDPGAEANYFGPYGHKVRFYSSPFINSTEQAASAAGSILASNSGEERGLWFEATSNPAIAPGDVARIIAPTLDVDELHRVDGFTIGLTADALVGVG